jgi:hypothetical protein
VLGRLLKTATVQTDRQDEKTSAAVKLTCMRTQRYTFFYFKSFYLQKRLTVFSAAEAPRAINPFQRDLVEWRAANFWVRDFSGETDERNRKIRYNQRLQFLQQCSSEEECWAHNPKVHRSKRCTAKQKITKF